MIKEILNVQARCPECCAVLVLDGPIAVCPECAWPFVEEYLEEFVQDRNPFMPVIKKHVPGETNE